MEREMMGIWLRQKRRNECIRQITKITDITTRRTLLKWTMPDKVRIKGNRWNAWMIKWRPWTEKEIDADQ